MDRSHDHNMYVGSITYLNFPEIFLNIVYILLLCVLNSVNTYDMFGLSVKESAKSLFLKDVMESLPT